MVVVLSKQAEKAVESMDSLLKQRIKKSIDLLTERPPKGDIKQMQGYSQQTYQLRVGKYRIVFMYDANENNGKTLFIYDIGSRVDIYK